MTIRFGATLAALLLGSASVAASAGPGDSERPDPVVVETKVAAAPSAAWRAWTDPAAVRRFFAPAARIDPRIGGAYEIYFLPREPKGLQGSEGATLLALEPPHRLVFSWNAPVSFGPLREQLTVVEVEIEPVGANASRVVLTHSGFGRGERWQEVRDYFAGAWPTVLKRYAEAFGPAPQAN